METLKINMPNMQSAHCMGRVTDIINNLEGVAIIKIEPGLAALRLDDVSKEGIVIEALAKGGYPVTGKEWS